MTSRECETCIKRKTVYCPNSIECMATDDKPYYQNRIMLLEENQELKKQVEELDKKLFFTKNELDMRQKSIDNKLNQQKEFIKYLENMLDDENDIFSVVRVKDVLQKYKEIIGGRNE